MNHNRVEIRGLMAVVAILALCVSCRERAEVPDGGGYRTMCVELSDRELHSDYPATVRGRQDVPVYPQISGLVTRVCVDEGSEVKKGQTLYVIDQTPYIAAVETAQAGVASAEAGVATARLNEESKEELFRENVVSEFDLQQSRNALRSAGASLAEARAALTVARNNLSYTEIKSPVDGTAGMSTCRVGTLATTSSPLVNVSDNAVMHAYFSMTEKQILSLSRQNGSLVDVLQAMPEVGLILSDGSGYPEKGKVDAISGMVDTSTGSVTLRAAFPNPDGILRSGGTGNVRLPYVRKDCIVIPQSATYELQDRIFVYRVVDGKTKSAGITVSPLNDGREYIVESGLVPGDVIVAEGAGLLREGMAVGTAENGEETK